MPIFEYNPNIGVYRGQLPAASNPFVIDGRSILAGTFQLSSEEVKQIMSQPGLKWAWDTRVAMGQIRELPCENPIDGEPSIADYNPTRAKAMVDNCVDVALLKRWQSEDARPATQKAIAKQLESLSAVIEGDTPTSKKSTRSAKNAPPNVDDMPVFA